ncbi:MAG: glucosaminidase domain-containing protein [Prevotella sp.]|nr:glucosaminidase domain-containing protein [Prevotella sp.]
MKRAILLLFLPIWALQPAVSQSARPVKAYLDYFEAYRDIAVEQMRQHGIPASITLAQGVLESGAGKSELARKGNNHFGIKCSGWTGSRTYHDDDRRGECFRAYPTVLASYEDHSAFLVGGRRYSSLFRLRSTDYKGWARGLQSCGYATSPTYATNLINIIELYKLYRYDTAAYRKGKRGRAGVMLREEHEFNSNRFVVARSGDTFQSIAADLDMSARTLARINERDQNAPLEDGERIWLKKKRRKGPKEYKDWRHRIEAGESMYSISQQYGIRLKSLYKLNGLPPSYMIRVGDELRIR